MSQRIEVGQMLCTWLNRLLLQNSANNKYSSTNFTLKAQQLLLSAHAELSNIANKTGNVNLSQFHLFKYSKLVKLVNNDAQMKNINNFNSQYNPGLDNSQVWSKNFQPISNSINLNYFTPKYINGDIITDDFLNKKLIKNSFFVENFSKSNDSVSNLKMFLKIEKMVS